MSVHDNAIFPTNINYGSSGGPGYSVSVIEMDSGQEERTARWVNARRTFDINYTTRSWDELHDIYTFFLARDGSLYGFLYKDWIDYSSAANGRDEPDDEDQDIGIGDNSETQFQLIKKYTDSGTTKTRNIEKVKSGTLVIALDGAPTTAWNCNYTTGIVTFDSAPGTDVEITAGFEFYIPVRFGEDVGENLKIALEHYEEGSIVSITLIELKDERQVIDEFNFGGAYDHGNLSGDADVTAGQGRVHTFNPLSAGLDINLPVLTDIPAGGPHYYFVNEGSYEMTIKDSVGGTVLPLPADGRATMFVSINVSAVKSWYGK